MNNMLAVISGDSVINAIIWMIVAGLIYWVLSWALAKISLPEPFQKIATALLVLVIVVILVNALLGISGMGFIHWGR